MSPESISYFAKVYSFGSFSEMRKIFKSFPLKLLLWSSSWIVFTLSSYHYPLWRLCRMTTMHVPLQFAQSARTCFEAPKRGWSRIFPFEKMKMTCSRKEKSARKKFFASWKKCQACDCVRMRVSCGKRIRVNQVHHHHTTYKLIMILMTFLSNLWKKPARHFLLCGDDQRNRAAL